MQKLKVNLSLAKAKKLLSGGAVQISYRAMAGGALLPSEEKVVMFLKPDQVAQLNSNPKSITIQFDENQAEKHVLEGGAWWKKLFRGIRSGAKWLGKIVKPVARPILNYVANAAVDTIPGGRQALDLFKQGVQALPGGDNALQQIDKATDKVLGSGANEDALVARVDYILSSLHQPLLEALKMEASVNNMVSADMAEAPKRSRKMKGRGLAKFA